MNKEVLKTGVQEFIKKKWNTDTMSVLLKKPAFTGISSKELVQQLEGKKKCNRKLPLWFATSKIYYPKKIHIEQTSSEITAQYKAQIVAGNSLLDCTGGLGVDSYFFSKKVTQVFHCEIDAELSKIAKHNFEVLETKNIQTTTQNGLEYLTNSDTNFDWIYIDPSRRNKTKGKVFYLADCLPDVPKHLDLIFNKTTNVLIKTSPLLDLSMGCKELQFVKEIHIIAIQNEVKELLWVLEKDYADSLCVKTINYSKTEIETFQFYRSDEHKATVNFSLPLHYLYEPNAAILKAGAFKAVGQALDVSKLHEHSHLYSSDTLKAFPGRRFQIHEIIPYNKKSMRSLQLTKANITTRNFPENVASIRKKYKIKDGGNMYLFFTTNIKDERIVICCTKVSE